MWWHLLNPVTWEVAQDVFCARLEACMHMSYLPIPAAQQAALAPSLQYSLQCQAQRHAGLGDHSTAPALVAVFGSA
jgi:hypothetical protein